MINKTKLICFYGPESTGKSVMAKQMAEHYQTIYVPEVAREIVSSNNFTLEDIIEIGKAQNERVLENSKTANKFLFCDTDLITTQIYCRHYLYEVPPILFELEKQVVYDHYFLFDIDVPWVADGMRDQGTTTQRRKMFEVFKYELDKRSMHYQIIAGDWETRASLIRSKLEWM